MWLRYPLFASLLLAVASCSQPLPRPDCRDGTPFGTVCGFENPEDFAYVPGERALIVSNLRLNGRGGYLSYLSVGDSPRKLWPLGHPSDVVRTRDLADDACPPPDPAVFAPHGVYADLRDKGAPQLYAVNHGGRESVEIFGFGMRGSTTVLSWFGCIELPAGAAGNDVAVARDGEVLVSNYLPPHPGLREQLRVLFGLRTGAVLGWKRGRGWRTIPGTESSAPNGVEVSRDGKWVYFAATGEQAIHRVARDGSGAASTARVPGRPDNLSWTPRGTLLLPSHDSALAFAACARREPCRSPWRLLEVNPETLAAAEVYEDDGDALGAAAAAQEVGETTYVSAVFGDRIGTLRRPAAATAP